jgi:hypothetical protein
MRRWGNHTKTKSREEKLKLIQSILNGNFDYDAYNFKPRHFQVFHEQHTDSSKDVYSVTAPYGDQPFNQTFNKEQYEDWSSKLHDQDMVFMISFTEDGMNEPLKEDLSSLGITTSFEPKKEVEQPIQAAEQKPRKRPAIEPEKEPEQIDIIKIEENYFPVMRNYGKLSEYGETWRLTKN